MTLRLVTIFNVYARGWQRCSILQAVYACSTKRNCIMYGVIGH